MGSDVGAIVGVFEGSGVPEGSSPGDARTVGDAGLAVYSVAGEVAMVFVSAADWIAVF
jgi:hypothetical protein